jgi:hypothetical protein
MITDSLYGPRRINEPLSTRKNLLMGFSDFAASIIRNNRRLQKNLKSKYFDRRINNSSKTKEITSKEKRNNSTANYKRRKSIIKQLVIITSIVIICLVVILFLSDRAIVDYKDSYIENLELISEKTANVEAVEAYSYLVRLGNSNLKAGNLEAARNDFQKAKDLFNNGKEVNLGITKCLLIQCKKNFVNCDIGLEYLELLKSSKLLSGTEISELESFKNNSY